jgi:cytochrome oxidase Cu insertion factor (SCO1/SenC/PrrC family)
MDLRTDFAASLVHRVARVAVTVVAAVLPVALPATALLAPAGAAAQSGALPGQPAPAFTLRDTGGRTVSLADFKGRTVVLEWTNPGCPFVQKHYESRNLPGLQAKLAGRDLAWVLVASTNPDHPDWLEPAALEAKLKTWGAAPTAVLMDPEGTAGRAYGARTTPQMWVIDAGGTIRFAGGIDDRRSANAADIPGARNHVAAALDDMKAGRPVAVASAPPYGCSVKYR